MCVLINDDKTFEEHEKPDTFVYPEVDQYKLHVSHCLYLIIIYEISAKIEIKFIAK